MMGRWERGCLLWWWGERGWWLKGGVEVCIVLHGADTSWVGIDGACLLGIWCVDGLMTRLRRQIERDLITIKSRPQVNNHDLLQSRHIRTELALPVIDRRGIMAISRESFKYSYTLLCCAPLPPFRYSRHRHHAATQTMKGLHQATANNSPTRSQQSAEATPLRPHVAIPLCSQTRPGQADQVVHIVCRAWPGLAASKTTATRLRPSRSPSYGQDSSPS